MSETSCHLLIYQTLAEGGMESWKKRSKRSLFLNLQDFLMILLATPRDFFGCFQITFSGKRYFRVQCYGVIVVARYFVKR